MIDGFLEALAGLLVAVGQQVEDEGHDLGEVAVHLLLTVLRLQVPANQSGQCWLVLVDTIGIQIHHKLVG